MGLAILSTLPDDNAFPPFTSMDYALLYMVPEPAANTKPTRRIRGIVLPLALPYLALCFPQIYARSLPTLWGFPFFYWYQFAWVILTSVLLAMVYRKLKS